MEVCIELQIHLMYVQYFEVFNSTKYPPAEKGAVHDASQRVRGEV